MPKGTKSIEWPLVDSATLEAELGIRKTKRMELVKQLPSPLYWCTVPGGRTIRWNIRLIRNWMLNGDGLAHQAAIDAYRAYAEIE
ncbi:MAG: hypothetical protein DDT26_00824 [Dehalococcoidia bacterium]|nr:hypothetical protein [Chloroflexota bacterium]